MVGTGEGFEESVLLEFEAILSPHKARVVGQFEEDIREFNHRDI